MKRLISATLAVLILSINVCCEAYASSVYKVTLAIRFVENLIFSRYDVDMYLNDLKMENLPHGVDYSGSFYVEEGSNTLFFYKHEDKSVKGSIKFDVSGDTDISCRLFCFNNKVDLDSVKVTTLNTNEQDTRLPEETTEAPTQDPVITTEPTQEPIQMTPTPAPAEETTSEPTAVPSEDTIQKTEPVSFSDINLQLMSDEELAKAAAAIKEEQRARIKTKIVLDKTDVELSIGKSEKITAQIADLPEGEKKPEFVWTSSDKNIVSCNNGQIRAASAGKAVITCSVTLTDGTVVYEECNVKVLVPIKSINVDKKAITLNVDDKYTPIFTIQPDNATNKTLLFDSSEPGIASVDKNGVITGITEGNAVITAVAEDGSNKKLMINVKVVDERGSLGKSVVKLTGNKTGIVCEVLNNNFTDYNDIFRNTMTTTIVVTVTAAQLTQVNKAFDVDINDWENDIMYVGISRYDRKVLYMAYKDTDRKYWMVSVDPSGNTIYYSKEKYSEKDAMAFLEKNCFYYDGVTAEDYFRANEEIGSMQ